MYLTLLRRSLARAVLASLVVLGTAFGGFATVTTGVLYSLFHLETRRELGFLHFLMSEGYHRIYFAILFYAFVIASIWFLVVLISNLRHDEGRTNGKIDSWVRRMDR
jgi:hypothetical protein